jgi:integrase
LGEAVESVAALTEIIDRVVSGRSETRRGPGDHAARPAPHLCVAGGGRRVNVLVLQRMLGHTSAAMTLDTYNDLFDDDLDAAAVRLHSRYSHSSVGKLWARKQAGDSQQT